MLKSWDEVYGGRIHHVSITADGLKCIVELAFTWCRDKKYFKPTAQRPVRFIKGPVPWLWIEMAARLPGKALAVGLALRRLAGATKSKTVRLATSEVETLGVDRNAKSRALRKLEQAGLVTVERRPGCQPKVTILDLPG